MLISVGMLAGEGGPNVIAILKWGCGSNVTEGLALIVITEWWRREQRRAGRWAHLPLKRCIPGAVVSRWRSPESKMPMGLNVCESGGDRFEK